MKSDTRIDAIESRVEFQEDTIASLNEALVRQQERLDLLEQMLQSLIERIGEDSEVADQPPEPPPPHY
ncbi:MAG: SlyX family protein [Pseudomonadales bacterium]|nr:SlyX family protein [Pseudomonadales bacterium]